MKWMPFAILGGLALEAISAMIERHAVTVPMNFESPPFRIFQYGVMLDSWSHSARVRRVWFFVMKLPSWRWDKHDYGRQQGWQQLEVAWTGDRGWIAEYVPEQHR
jgi:hypothetical protein